MRTAPKTILNAVSCASNQTSEAYTMRHYSAIAVQCVFDALDADDTILVIEGSLDNTNWDVLSREYVFVDEINDGYTDGYLQMDGYSTSGTGSGCHILRHCCVPDNYIRVRFEKGSATTGTLTVKITAIDN